MNRNRQREYRRPQKRAIDKRRTRGELIDIKELTRMNPEELKGRIYDIYAYNRYLNIKAKHLDAKAEEIKDFKDTFNIVLIGYALTVLLLLFI